MNGTVLTLLFVGYAVGFGIYGFDCDRDKTLPVNCCAWKISHRFKNIVKQYIRKIYV